MKVRHLVILLLLFAIACNKDGNHQSTAYDNAGGKSGTGGSLARFIVVGNYLYLADQAELKVFDLSENGIPKEKEPVYVGWGIETIFSQGDNLFLGSSTGMFIFSLVDPARPALAGQAQHLRSCDPVVANDTVAFVTLRGGSPCGPATEGLYTYDITDSSNPELQTIFELSSPAGLALNQTVLYVCRKEMGLSVLDVSNAKAPKLLLTITNASFEDAIVYDTLLICYVSNGIRLYDISKPAYPVFINEVANN